MTPRSTHRTPTRWLLPYGALSLAGGILIGRAMELLWPALVCAAVALGAAIVMPAGKRRRLPLLALALTIGMMCGQAAYHPALPEEGMYTVQAVVADEFTLREDGHAATLLHSVQLNGKSYPHAAYWTFYLPDSADELPVDLIPGSTVTLTASVYHPQGAVNPGGYDLRENLLARGATIGVYGMTDLQIDSHPHTLSAVLAAFRHRCVLRFTQVMGDEAGGYAAAMLLGVKTLLNDADTAAFHRLGIGHVLAVSGYHVGVLCAVLVWLLRLLRVPRWGQIIPVGVLLTLYCIMTGLHAPVVRASLLVILGLCGSWLGRRSDRLHLLAASAIVILLLSPTQVTSAGFQLSYSALLGLLLIAPTLQRWFSHLLPRSKWLPQALAASIAAQLGVLLPQLYWFQELPLLGIISNVLLITLFSGLLLVYWVAFLCMSLPIVGPATGAIAAWLTDLMLRGVRLSERADWLLLWTRQANLLTALGWVLSLAGLCCLWRRVGRKQLIAAACGAVLLIVSILPYPTPGTRYRQLSAGSADAAVIEDNGFIAVVDTGEASELATYLHQRRESIDALFLTHLHYDHAGGVTALLRQGIPVRVCYLPYDAETADISPTVLALLDDLAANGTELRRISRGDVVALPSGEAVVLWPEEGRVRPGADPNDYSMAMQLRLHDTVLLLTGDLSGTYEQYAAVPADVLKAAHHGAATSTSEAFLQAVSPSLIVVSGGNRNKAEALRERAADLPLLHTSDDGCITLTINESGFAADTYRHRP